MTKTNGMLNHEALAIKNGIDQTGSDIVTINYNPTHGLFCDGLESGVDKQFNFDGMYTKKNDFVGEFLGNNKGKKMVKILLSFVVTLFFSACSYTSPYRATEPNELIQDEYIVIRAIDDSWEIDKEYNGHSWMHGLPVLYKTYGGFSYEIDFRTYPYRDGVVNRQLFDKDSLIDDSDIMPVVYDEIDKEQGIKYARGWVPYIKGMRCAGGVFSRSFGGTAYSATSKNYSIGCGYYDKQGGKRLLEISYRYYGGTGDTELQTDKDDNTKEKHLTPQEAETELKQALKEVLKTLKLKNFDKEKMIKEGLYHPNKAFESTKW